MRLSVLALLPVLALQSASAQTLAGIPDCAVWSSRLFLTFTFAFPLSPFRPPLSRHDLKKITNLSPFDNTATSSHSRNQQDRMHEYGHSLHLPKHGLSDRAPSLARLHMRRS